MTITENITNNIKPKLSIIMCNFNHAEFIEQAIDSVLSQTLQDWELIIVDDCSTDNSLSIIEKYHPDRRVKLIRHKKNKGYTASLITGIFNITSDLFGILDSDDVLTPEALETMYSAHAEYPNAGLIYSQFMYCDEGLKPFERGYGRQIPEGRTNLDSDCVSHFKTFKLKYYNQTEGYNEDIYYAQDKDISYKIEEVSKLQFIDKVLYYYKVHPKALSQGNNYTGLEYVSKSKMNALKRRHEKNVNQEEKAITHFKNAKDFFYREDFQNAEKEISEYKKTIKYELFPTIDNRQTANPDISVIVVAYHTNQLLLDCLNSLMAQNHKNFEIIIVDNGGNDEVLKQLIALPILYIKCPINFILSEGRNIGVHFAKAEIVSFLDDDAIVPDNYIKSIIEGFNTFEIVGLRGKILPKIKNEDVEWPDTFDLGDTPIPATIVAEGNSAFLKKKYQELNGMNPLLFGGEGLDLTMRIIEKYGEHLTIYWPHTIIYHDLDSNEKAEIKKKRYLLMDKYLNTKYPDIYGYYNRMAQYAKDNELQKKGNLLLKRKK